MNNQQRNLDVRFVPISKWPNSPTPLANQRESTFRASYTDTLDLLATELRKLNAHNITIQAFFKESDIRNDGWPRSSAEPTQSGVIVGFDKREWNAAKGRWDITAIAFPCDTFTTFDDNLRAIALALEALRKLDRYGVTQSGQQYTGWAQLPAAENSKEFEFSGRASAIAFLTLHGAMDIRNDGDVERAYRRAAAKLHPDNQTTGNHEAFMLLHKAKEMALGGTR